MTAPESEAARHYRIFQNGKELAPEELPLQRVTATGRPIWDFEEQIVFPDGTQADFLGNVVPLLDETGKPCGAVAALIDITNRKQAEETTRKLCRAVEQCPETVVITDLAGNIEYVNPKFTQLTGYAQEEVLGMNLSILKSGQTPEHVYQQMWDTILAGREWRGEFCNQKKNGEIYWESASISPISNGNGIMTHFIAVKEDITERKQTEAMLRENEARFRSLFENMLDGFAYCQMLYDQQDRPVDFVYLAVNDAFETLTGLENVIGRKASDVIPGIWETNPALLKTYGQVAQTGEPEKFILDLQPLAMWLSISVYSPARGFFIAVFDNITDRIQSEAVLRESEMRFRLAVEGIADEMWVCDRQGKMSMIHLAPQAALGLPEFKERSVEEVLEEVEILNPDGESRPPDQAPLLRSLRGEIVQGEVILRNRKTGNIRYRRFSSAPIRNPAGEITGAVDIGWDITEQKRALQAEQDQRRLAEALRDTAAALTGTLDLASVLDRILLNIHQVTAYDAVNIMLIDQKNQAGIVRYHRYGEQGVETYVDDHPQSIDEVPGLSWMAENRALLIITDTKNFPQWKERPLTAWGRSYAGIPIQAQGELIGFLNFDSATPRFFQREQIDQLVPFANQAALAILNARSFEETQRRAQRLALINRVTHTLNQPLELKTVLQVTVDCLAEALNLSQVAIALFNDMHDRLTITADHPGSGNQSLVASDIPLEGNRSMEIILRDRTALLIEDAQQDERLAMVRDIMVRRGIFSMLLVPIIVHDEVIGTIGCAITEPNRSLTREEIELAETITNLAAVRIEQARLFAEERKRASALALLHVTSLEITKENDLPSLLKTIVERAAWLMDAPGGTLYLADPQKKELTCRVCYNLPHDEVGTVTQYGEGAVGIVAETGKPLIIPDYGNWPYRMLKDEQIDDFLAVASVPVIWQNHLTGVIQLARKDRQRPFMPKDLDLLSLFSNQVAISLENARLYTEVQQIAIKDLLTGLYNRRGLFDVGQLEIERVRRFHRPLSALILDIDHFKVINDTYGHLVGDQVLAALAKIFRTQLRSIDIYGRYGGDEFVVLLLENDATSAVIVAERICRIAAQSLIATTVGEIPITVSIGGIVFDDAMNGLQDLIQSADDALYQAKKAGRNQVKFNRAYAPLEQGE